MKEQTSKKEQQARCPSDRGKRKPRERGRDSGGGGGRQEREREGWTRGRGRGLGPGQLPRGRGAGSPAAGGLAPSPRTASPSLPRPSHPFLLLLTPPLSPPPFSWAPTRLQLKPALPCVPREWIIVLGGGAEPMRRSPYGNVWG